MRILRRHAPVVLLAVILGCGTGTPKTVPVSGKVTLDTQPLANADVSFFPTNVEKGKMAVEASGKTDAEGNYSLKLNKGGTPGVPPGNYKVRVSVFDRGEGTRPPRGQLILPKYNRETTLTFEVPAGGTQSANFDLSSK
jgi:hypothetical protein